MHNSALFTLDWQRLTIDQLAFIKQQEQSYDELIFVLDEADEFPMRHKGLLCSDLMARLQQLLYKELSRPFFLLPISGKGQSRFYQWLRWRLLCPSFQQVFTDRPEDRQALQAVLKTNVQLIPIGNAREVIYPASQNHVRRGLFITRAQPLHSGHVAFMEQMALETDEVITVIAMANRSHQANDVLTAGERLTMTAPVLRSIAPGRHYLTAFPYSDYTMENFYELELLLPAFHYVYTTNPTVATMALSAGYETRGLKTRIPISSTIIRDHIIHDKPYNTLVPDSVHNFLQEKHIADRLKLLTTKEQR